MDCATQDPIAFDSRMCYWIPLVAWPWVLGCALFIADDHAPGF